MTVTAIKVPTPDRTPVEVSSIFKEEYKDVSTLVELSLGV